VTTKSAFLALGEPMSPALTHGTPYVEGLALPKFVESGNFRLNKLVIPWKSDACNPLGDELRVLSRRDAPFRTRRPVNINSPGFLVAALR